MSLTLCRAFLSKPTPRHYPAIHSLKQWVGGKPENDALEISGRFCFSTFCRLNGEGGSSLPRGVSWLPVTQTLGKITNMRQHAEPTVRMPVAHIMSQGRKWEKKGTDFYFVTIQKEVCMHCMINIYYFKNICCIKNVKSMS